ncbi:MAG TPA: hypothetical protein VMW58_10835 [Anaerolineae bacterium]|nr:hypothetical protein [Anaerolineae bacterium]
MLKLADVQFGPGAVYEGVKPQTIRAIVVAAAVFASFGFDCWVTSLVREYDADSFHAYGLAVDVDAPVEVPPQYFRLMRNAIAAQLGDHYDVVYHNGHIHIEYDVTGKDIELLKNGNRI